jgi:hypothetical protein
VAALVAAALLAGCGGDDGGNSSGPVTKELYIAQGDEVCAGLQERFETAGASDPQTPKQIVDSANVLGDLYGDLFDGLKDIELPARAADRTGAADYISGVGRTDAQLAELKSTADSFADAVDAKDKRKIESAGQAVRSALDAFRAEQAKANQAAIVYGFNLCGNLN